MAKMDHEYPIWEEYPPESEGFSAPCEEAEFCPPDTESEFSPPPRPDYANPDPDREFDPPGRGSGDAPPSRRKRRKGKRLLFALAACVLVIAAWPASSASRGSHSPGAPLVPSAPAATAAPPETDTAPPPETDTAPTPEPVAVPTPEPVAVPTPEPTPLSKVPVITTDFFFFSHEHHARVHMDNIGALHSVQVTVRDKVLDKQAYDHFLSEEEIASGLFELPMLSTGDLFMENLQAYQDINAWPEFELTVKAWYENDTGDGEDMLTLTVEPDFELGIGISYQKPSWDWDADIPADSFVVTPWEETDEIRYVINDPDAVRDPLTFSVDISYNGRHAAPEEYEEIVAEEEYTLITGSGDELPQVSYTKKLVLRRPDWIPEEGVIHVKICQYLASTGEIWVRETDFSYTPEPEI